MFQQDAYISVDMLEKQTQIIKLEEAAADEDVENVLQTVRGPKTIDIRMPEIQAVNAIKMELETFHDCIVNNKKPYVTLEDGIEALDLAYKIIANDKMD
jgi:predicted dehydrogenase